MPNATTVANEPIIDELFEDKVLSCTLYVTEFASVAAQHLKPSYFSSPARHNIAKVGIDFFNKYGSIPSPKALVDELKMVVKPADMPFYGTELVRLSNVDRKDFKWVLEKLITFIKNREIKKLIEASVTKHLPKNNFEEIEKEMAKIAAITTSSQVKPTFYFSDDAISGREARREQEYQDSISGKVVGISTGIPAMDKTLPKGGWYRGELYIIMAPPKRGKTMSLLWFANIAAWQGYNVAFFTLETSIEVLSDRMDAMNAMIETKVLVSQRTHLSRVLKARNPKGEIAFFEYPTKACKVAEVDRQLSKLEVEHAFEKNLVVVDYGDIMKPARSRENKLDEQAGIFEDLRAIASKYKVPVLTATQINRTGTGKAKNTGTDVSGTYEKIMVADCVISLSATDDELTQGKLRVSFAESRNNERKSFLIETKYNFGTFYGDFLGEEF